MYYFFKQHEENFKEWRKSEYQGIPSLGVDFLKHLPKVEKRTGADISAPKADITGEKPSEPKSKFIPRIMRERHPKKK